MPGNLAYDVEPVLQPRKLAPRGRREDCDLAIFALVALLGYVFAIESDTSSSVV